MFKVSIETKHKLIFEGMASTVIVPGLNEQFTLLPFHSPVMIRLQAGIITVDEEEFSIYDGVCRFERNEFYALVEEVVS